MEHRLPLTGIGNARELGGYRIGDRQIRGGVLLRTAGLDRATPEALDVLQNQYHVQTVIDLRMSMEQQLQPDPEIPGAKNIHLPVLELEDMLAGADPKLVEQYTSSNMDRMALFNSAYESGMLNDKLYIEFLLRDRGMTAYRRFFEALLALDEGHSILWHCTDGKDRTGCAAMLTLFALGAERETVMSDYLLTNVYNAQMLEGVRQKVAPLQMPPGKLDALMFMCGGVNERYMNNAIDALTHEFGSIRGYLSEALGVGDEEIKILRHKLLQ